MREEQHRRTGAGGPILTVTPNPSLDLLFEADAALVWDDANRMPMPRRRPGGQGINVVRAARALGGRGRAVAPLGGAAGRELEQVLAAEGVPLRAVPIAGDTRIFVAAHERPTGRTLLLNPRGPELGRTEWTALRDAVREELSRAPVWLAGCGSLPPGVPSDFYAGLARTAREHGVRFVADCDGEALRRAAEAGADLLIPNHHEAGRLLGRTVRDVADAADAAAALLERGPALAAVTLGARGAVIAAGAGVWHAAAPRMDRGSAVGAGDAFLAALLIRLEAGAEAPEALRAAVAAGTAVLLGTGDTLLRPADARAVEAEVVLRRVA